VIQELQAYGIDVHVHDPVADSKEAQHEYGLELKTWENLPRAEAIVAAVSHREFLAKPLSDYLSKVAENGCFIDVKSQYDQSALRKAGLSVWRL